MNMPEVKVTVKGLGDFDVSLRTPCTIERSATGWIGPDSINVEEDEGLVHLVELSDSICLHSPWPVFDKATESIEPWKNIPLLLNDVETTLHEFIELLTGRPVSALAQKLAVLACMMDTEHWCRSVGWIDDITLACMKEKGQFN